MPADLFNSRTKSIEPNVADSEVNDKILSGDYDYHGNPGDKVFLMSAETGAPMEVPISRAGLIIQNGQAVHAPPTEVEGWHENKAFAGTGLGQGMSALAGLDYYLTGGGIAAILERAGAVNKGLTSAMAEENPMAYHGTGLPASVMAAIFSSGASAAARGAAVAPKAISLLGQAGRQEAVGSAVSGLSPFIARKGFARETAKQAIYNRKIEERAIRRQAQGIVGKGFNQSGKILGKYTVPGVAAKLGVLAAENVTQGLLKVGNKVAPYRLSNYEAVKRFGPQAAKVVGATIGAGVENGAWGTAAGAGEAILGEPEDAAEHILNSIGSNGLVGLMFGGAVASAVPSLLAAKGLGLKFADKMADATGIGGETLLKKLKPHIIKTAVETHRLSPSQARRYGDLLTLQESGSEAYFKLKELITRLDKHASSILKHVDTQLLLDDYIQMADIGGFDKAFLAREARVNSRGHGMPKTPHDLFENITEPFRNYRVSLEQLARKHPEANASGLINNLIIDSNIDEMNLYRSFFDETAYANLKAVNVGTRDRLRAQRVARDADKLILDRWKETWKYALSDSSKYDEIVEKIKERHYWEIRNTDRTTSTIRFDEGELRFVLGVAADTGDIDPLIEFIKRVSPPERRRVMDIRDTIDAFMGSQFSGGWRSVKRIIEKEVEDLSEDHLDHSEKMIGILNVLLKDEISRLNALRSTKFSVKRLENIPVNAFEDLSFRSGSQFATREGDAATFDIQGLALREALQAQELLMGSRLQTPLGSSFYDRIADAFKALENSQTRLFNELYYGSTLPKAMPGVETRVDGIIENLRTEMKNKEKWGILASHKQRFDDMAIDFTAYKDQNLARFTSGSGITQVASVESLKTYLGKLDRDTAMADTEKLKNFSVRGKQLMELIRDQFDAAAINDLPTGENTAKGKVSARLEKLNMIPLDRPLRARKPIKRHFENRINDLINFFDSNSRSLESDLRYLREEMPIANLLMGPHAAASNMNQSLREMGRGGAMGALAYTMSGSPQIAMAMGLLAGISGMAQQPRTLVNLVQQLRAVKKVSKSSISEYLDSWASDQVPKSALHKGWEHQSRQAFLLSTAPLRQGQGESRAEMRKKAAQTRSVDAWQSRIEDALGDPLEADSFFEARDSINQLSSSIITMERFLDETTRPFEDTPDIRKAMKSLLKNHVKIAKKAIPKTSRASMFNEEYPPTPVQLQKFANVLQMLTDPVETLLTGMITGTLTTEMVATLREAWPKVFSDVYEKSLEILSDKDKMKNLSQAQKQTLSTLLGIPYASQDELSRQQGSFGMEEDGPGGKGPGGTGFKETAKASSIGTSTATVERARL